MKTDRTAKLRIIHKSYIRLSLVNMAVLMITNVCGFINNIVISRFLGTQELAAVGFFSPVAVLAGLVYVIILGTAVVCGNLIGSGQHEKVNSLFTGSFKILTIYSVIFGLVLVLFRDPLSALLGAQGDVRKLLAAYITGYAPGILFSTLTSYLLSLASFNNEINRSYISSAVMLCGNIIFDLTLVKPLGLLGIGLAYSLSSFAAFLILLPGFIGKSKTFRFQKAAFDPSLVAEAARRGLPSLLFTGGMLVKNSLTNYTLMTYVGNDGIAIANVLGSVCGIVGTFCGGYGSAYSTLASLFYGEDDRGGFTDLFRYSLRMGFLSLFLVVALMAVFSAPLTGIFFKPGTEVWNMGQRMFLIGFWFFPLNLILNMLLRSYQAQGKMMLMNVMSFAETALAGLILWAAVPSFGTDAAWLANLWSDILSVLIVLISVITWKKGVSLSVPDFLKLPENFGAGPDESAEYSLLSEDQVSAVSEAVIAFCKERSMDERKAFWAGLCVEEMTSNIFKHGASGGKQIQADVRIVCRDDLTIRIQDDCRKFDPRERMNMFSPETPEKNIGLRMVAKLASYVDYYNDAGINTLIIKI